MRPHGRSSCENKKANVRANEEAINKGFFIWPISFDPMYLVDCDGFEEKNKKVLKDLDE